MSGLIIAIDGGATKTRAVAFDTAGHVLAEAAGGPSNHLAAAREVVRQSLSDAIRGVIEGCGISLADVELVSAGLAGVDYNGAGAEEARVILGQAGIDRCAVFGDMVIAHAGALDGKPGVMALAGTGAVFLGQAPDGRWAKAGGWGYRFGDEGSAYWIGRMAVAAASRAYDGRGPATLLEEAICQELGLADFSGALDRIYGKKMDARAFAALSRVVDGAARDGDAVAAGILDRAAEELAVGTGAVIERLRAGAGASEWLCTVSWAGSVLNRCQHVRRKFIATISSRLEGVKVMPPARRAVYGAWILGCRALGREFVPATAPE
ncbi:MAG: hypothetical protein IT160_03340 [Bryobacterales bacterium]|nr:hypothetical protein [Bryobacterales bacterium]